MPLDRAATRRIEPYRHMFAIARCIVFSSRCTHVLPDFLGINNFPPTIARAHLAGIANLSTHLGVADRIVQNHSSFPIRRRDRDDIGAGMIVIVAKKIRDHFPVRLRQLDRGLLLRRPRTRSLFLHQLFETLLIHCHPALARHQLREIKRKALFIVQAKSERARDAGERTRLACLVRRLAGRTLRPGVVLARPKPWIMLAGRCHLGSPRILANINKLFLQVALGNESGDQTIPFPIPFRSLSGLY